MGVFIAFGVADNPHAAFESERSPIAIIDRDQSTISAGLSEFLSEHATIMELEDSHKAMQDAVAQNYVLYILIIPEGFGENFVAGAASDSADKDVDDKLTGTQGNGGSNTAQAPELETVVSNVRSAANMLDGLVDEYLGTMSLYINSNTTTNQSKLVELTSANMREMSEVKLVEQGNSVPVSQRWILYMKFVSYTAMVSIVVCIGVMLAAFNRTDIRRRNLIAPLSPTSINLQVALACVFVGLLAWLWTTGLGLAVFGHTLGGVDLAIIGIIVLGLLALCTVARALGFLIGQLTGSDVVVNAAGNITSLVLAFFGGVWIPLDFVGPEVAFMSHFSPVYYYNAAMDSAVNLHEYTGATLSPIFANIGICLLFAVTIFSVALAVGRLKTQSADAGGNAAAAKPSNS
jgi:ABC-2 type transport system permease protein